MELDKPVGFAVKTLSNEIKRAIDRNFRNKCGEVPGKCGHPHDHHESEEMTGMQRWIMQHLYEQEKQGAEVFQKDIENRFNIRRSTVTGILQLMEKNGYVERQPVEWDARLKKLVLTKKATDMQKMVERELQEMEAKFTKGISEEDLEIFFRVINQIKDNLQD